MIPDKTVSDMARKNPTLLLIMALAAAGFFPARGAVNSLETLAATQASLVRTQAEIIARQKDAEEVNMRIRLSLAGLDGTRWTRANQAEYHERNVVSLDVRVKLLETRVAVHEQVLSGQP